MKFFKNLSLMLAVNLGIIVTISIVLSLLGFNNYGGYGRGMDIQSLAIFCLIWGMAGSFISLLLSKKIVKWTMGVQIIDPRAAEPVLMRYHEVVRRAAERAGLPKTPEVGIYESPELNAFATGPSRSNSLVAVSTGLLGSMSESELEGVIGHEVAHIANGDMVTMTLLQGVVNALVMFLARIVASIVASSLDDRSRYWVRFLLVTVFEIGFGIVGIFVTSWYSRRREFRADAGGAAFMGRDKMIAALEALKNRNRVHDTRAPEMAAFKISSARKSGGLVSLMTTHPPLERRIEALRRGQFAT